MAMMIRVSLKQQSARSIRFHEPVVVISIELYRSRSALSTNEPEAVLPSLKVTPDSVHSTGPALAVGGTTTIKTPMSNKAVLEMLTIFVLSIREEKGHVSRLELVILSQSSGTGWGTQYK
jgi:hypothetical protein